MIDPAALLDQGMNRQEDSTRFEVSVIRCAFSFGVQKAGIGDDAEQFGAEVEHDVNASEN